MREAVPLSAARTATGKFFGSLRGFAAPHLGSPVGETVRRAGLEPAAGDESARARVVDGRLDPSPARQAAPGSGLSDGVGAVTGNMVLTFL